MEHYILENKEVYDHLAGEYDQKSCEREPYNRATVERRLYAWGLVDFLRDTFNPTAIILFGSASRGEDREDSDIDIFMEAPEKRADLARFEKKSIVR